ncbi:uncharacterized protein ASCRUDRAFT_21208, partial [Ascoidea rubescens DSM 1968]
PIRLAHSGTYIYPFLGISYWMRHRNLWQYWIRVLPQQILIASIIFITCFVWFYPIQALVSFYLQGPSAFLSTFILIFYQAGMISRLVLEKTILKEPLRKIFDEVLINQGLSEFVAKGKLIIDAKNKEKKEKRKAQPLQRRIYDDYVAMFFSVSYITSIPYSITKTVFLLVLHSIPIIGPWFLLFLKSGKKGRTLHQRYYDLKDFDERQIKTFYRARSSEYSSFGFVALTLETIPIIGMFFTFTDVVGASLWAADLE